MADPRLDELKVLLPRCLLRDWVRLGARAARVLRDRHHAVRHDALLERLLERARASAALREQRAAHVPAVSYPPELPITPRKDDIVAAIRRHPVVVIAGETGSGKTTEIPKMCLEAGLGIEATIGCTQPRRVAAVSISRRIAEELGVAWGREVGCKIRFDDRSSPETHIKLMTDGILLAEAQQDPDLSEYNALVIDEAHERSLNIDFLLGHLKGLIGRRPDLKLVITSATIDTTAFSEAFGGAPIIEVSGRLYPVEVRYAPLDVESEDRGEVTYVDAAVAATEGVLAEPGRGDVLVFMPSERDIRETCDLLEGRLGGTADLIPLFGRLSMGEQQRVFASGSRRKVVVATNIAETSLTIPGIRYVIDTGLARISRYNPRTRTRRLPVEPVSQGSANQRKGRAGRVQDGVCIRLYSEDDFQERPPFTQPELQRANLAEVILRMKAFHLGDIETFPFLNPPTPASIQAGYRLLQELGALDAERELTPLGQDLARLPIDPTLGRMLLQSQREHAVREVLIIASGLSIQDPRERPSDQAEAAAAAHRRFADPRSDFLALLNLWNAFHDEWESLRTQNQRRRFCRTHFLSYLRMREWQDLHAQLHDALDELGTVRLNESNADYGAIHRSILAGLLGHVATRVERNVYRAPGNRQWTLFPATVLFERGARPSPPGNRRAAAATPARSSQPDWIVAGEIVETSQVFARTVAGIDSQWIVDLAPHLCQVTHLHPRWSRGDGRVVADEIVTLHGLEVRRRKVAYGNINPAEATALFIRAALIEEQILPTPNARDDADADDTRVLHDSSTSAGDARARYPFLQHNAAVRQKLENWQTRLRRPEFGDLDEALFQFYAARLENMSSRDDLNRALREKGKSEQLQVQESDLTGGREVSLDPAAFPDSVQLAGLPVSVRYAYAPGEEWDGVTVRLPVEVAQTISPAAMDWAVPSLRADLVRELLGSLPKSHRRILQPFSPKVDEILRDLRPAGPTLLHDLSRFIRDRYGVVISVSEWRPDALSAHLRPRIEVVTDDRMPLAAGRDLGEIRAALERVKTRPATDLPGWQRAVQEWERSAVTAWTFGDLPDRVTVGEASGKTMEAWPGLVVEEGSVHIRLFRTETGARAASPAAVRRLVELALAKELAWLERDLRGLRKLAALYAPLGSPEDLEASALEGLRAHVLSAPAPPALTEAHFRAAVDDARRRIPGVAQRLIDRVGAVLELRQQVAQRLGGAARPPVARPADSQRTLKDFAQLMVVSAPRPAAAAPPLVAELEALVAPRFPALVPFERLPHLVRYLRALQLRAERAALNPVKDRERVALLTPYLAILAELRAARDVPADTAQGIEDLRWMLEEYRVSLFAQELGTSVPVSPKRLDELVARLRPMAL